MTCKGKCCCDCYDNKEAILASSRASLTEEIVKMIDDAKANEEFPDSQLIAILHKIQNHYGYVGEQHIEAVSQLLGVPSAKVSGVVTFYHYFRTIPRGKFMISLCLGTACYVKGAELVLQAIEDYLGINVGETTEDGVFSLEVARCIGCCGLAPVMMINGKVFGPLTPEKIPAILSEYQKESEKTV